MSQLDSESVNTNYSNYQVRMKCLKFKGQLDQLSVQLVDFIQDIKIAVMQLCEFCCSNVAIFPTAVQCIFNYSSIRSQQHQRMTFS